MQILSHFWYPYCNCSIRWTVEKSEEMFRENTAMSEHEIQSEVQRYITMPGQVHLF